MKQYGYIVDEEKGKLNEDGTLNLNPNSLTVLQGCKLEKAFEDAKPGEAFQFLRNGFFCVDSKDSTKEHPVYNRIVSSTIFSYKRTSASIALSADTQCIVPFTFLPSNPEPLLVAGS